MQATHKSTKTTELVKQNIDLYAPINIFRLDQMSLCNVKGVACSNKPIELFANASRSIYEVVMSVLFLQVVWKIY